MTAPTAPTLPGCSADCTDRCCDMVVAFTAECGCSTNQYHDVTNLCPTHLNEYNKDLDRAERIADEEAFGYYRSDDRR